MGQVKSITILDRVKPVTGYWLCMLFCRLLGTIVILHFQEKIKPKKRNATLVLPPVQVSRTMNPNSNYYRKISADYHKKRDKFKRSMKSLTSPIQERLSILDQINATGISKSKLNIFSKSIHINQVIFIVHNTMIATTACIQGNLDIISSGVVEPISTLNVIKCTPLDNQ